VDDGEFAARGFGYCGRMEVCQRIHAHEGEHLQRLPARDLKPMLGKSRDDFMLEQLVVFEREGIVSRDMGQ